MMSIHIVIRQLLVNSLVITTIFIPSKIFNGFSKTILTFELLISYTRKPKIKSNIVFKCNNFVTKSFNQIKFSFINFNVDFCFHTISIVMTRNSWHNLSNADYTKIETFKLTNVYTKAYINCFCTVHNYTDVINLRKINAHEFNFQITNIIKSDLKNLKKKKRVKKIF